MQGFGKHGMTVEEAEDNAASDELAHDVKAQGPFREFLRDIISPRRDPSIYDLREMAYVVTFIPPRRSWSTEALDAARDEIVGFSVDPASAERYLDRRLGMGVGEWMEENAGGFVSGLRRFCARMDLAMPDLARVIVLKAVLVRLHDVADKATAS